MSSEPLLEDLLHLLCANEKLDHLDLLGRRKALVHNCLVVIIEPDSLLLVLDMFELHAHRGAVNLIEVLLGLLDRADLVNEGPGHPIIQGVARDGLQLVQLPVVQVEAGGLLELQASIMRVTLWYTLQTEAQGVHLGSQMPIALVVLDQAQEVVRTRDLGAWGAEGPCEGRVCTQGRLER